EGCPPCLPKGGLGLGILDLARMTSQSSGESQVMNELFLSRSAWLIESHWSSFRLPGKTNSSASRSGNHGALSGSKTWAASNFAEGPPSGSPYRRLASRRLFPEPTLAALERARSRRRCPRPEHAARSIFWKESAHFA